ncbi:uncharacterized protein si:ch211-57n23.1 [Salvelinus namaycush]|uniref:Uncharacterized protein si:ch211-57n23.1 n=1 Tax=Salvelinus namaycush TaxID=8040 RepID=A0A8U0PCI1_SALNM|nr:uncharacterized protein si:ch211-57n23.1 [Salvelinus namaycush]XP_038821946.1 uncharacterized protein si:ch211-57n23.1 [Salvelinus namaycush]
MKWLHDGTTSWAWLCLSCCLLSAWCPVGAEVGPTPNPESGEPMQGDWEWGSGSFNLQDLLHSFPADSPFVTEIPGNPVNCSQRFWLPSASPVCWDDIAGPEEFEQSRLLVLQNRAALQAVSLASEVVVEGGTSASFKQQALEDLQVVRADYLNVTETTETMQKVFLTLEEKRKEGTEHWTFSSIKEHIAKTKDSINGKDNVAALLEKQFSSLEKSLHIMQLRLDKLMAQ